MSQINFPAAFEALTGHSPLKWQRRLFTDLVAERSYDAIDLPTGLGKSSTIVIWLLALAETSKQPRRLVYVVNRRTIVDQATSIVENLQRRLNQPDDGDITAIDPVRVELAKLAGLSNPPPTKDADAPDDPDRHRLLAVSTLRGQLADNREWMNNPARAAVIVGTVDMIGSRLLFNGYRAGSWQLSRQAGLLGQDTLLLHDEAHLSEPFQKLIEWIRDRQKNDHSPRPMRVMAMSATHSTDGQNRVFRLSDEDRREPIVRWRVNDVKKQLHLHRRGDEKLAGRALTDRLVELACQHIDKQAKVIVFVRLPSDAANVHDAIRKRLKDDAAKRTALLTGAFRGYEREGLIDHPAVAGLLPSADKHPLAPSLNATTYLVATSAGEVGADFDADHLVCDLAPIDSMIQRLGRVNRRGGEGRSARIDVVLNLPEKGKKKKDGSEHQPSKLDQAILATAELLRTLPSSDGEARDASPAALLKLRDNNPEYEAALSPQPEQVVPHDVVLDAWSLTSVQEDWPLAHDVHPYLHGLDEETPETFVAWRAELDALPRKDDEELPVEVETIRAILRHHPLRSIELLQEKPKRVAELLLALRERGPDRQIIIARRRTIEVKRLKELPNDTDALARELQYKTVILPPKLGGLGKAGMIQPADPPLEPVLDVADLIKADGKIEVVRRRVLLVRENEEWKIRTLTPEQATAEIASDQSGHRKWSLARDTARNDVQMKYVDRVVLEEGDNGPQRMLLFFRKEVRAANVASSQRVTITEHNRAVRTVVERISRSSGLASALCEPLVRAAESHDLGKDDPRWQSAIDNASEPLAKSWGRGFNPRVLGGYRHEFGSLRAIAGQLPDDGARDLTLHLGGSHHGRGRPHFEIAAMSVAPGFSNDIHPLLEPAEIARRFARLQRLYGHWGLAWLESILMAADIEGSAVPSMLPADQIEEDEA